ncbi:helix-turn-helix domain-containing protein [Nonomuraea sp. NPDC050394]|uniref:helix-turn-helix domain-containing protein n=1 Tax=Nonomuraea sp. NPDC050394 TaxID=3364363 RepID=UPI0037930EE0
MTDHLNPENVRVGATIRALATAHGWKVGELAAALDKSHGYISNVMAGRKYAHPQLCRQIAELLNVPLAAIVSGEAYERALSLAGSEAGTR